MTSSDPLAEVLFVCTANICRSPFAEVALAACLAGRGVPLSVRSAGLLAGGQPAAPGIAAVAEVRGLDLARHRSHRLEPDDVARADLVLGLAREHVRESVLLMRDSWGRSFTLRELVRRGASIGPRRAREGLAAWLARAHAGRSAAEYAGTSAADDVADPYGGPPEGYERAAAEIDALVEALAELAWPEPPLG